MLRLAHLRPAPTPFSPLMSMGAGTRCSQPTAVVQWPGTSCLTPSQLQAAVQAIPAGRGYLHVRSSMPALQLCKVDAAYLVKALQGAHACG